MIINRAKYIFNVMIGKVSDPLIPIATYWIIFANTIIWLFETQSSKVTIYFSMSPYIAPIQVWRYITAAFLHNPASPIHLFANMFSLYIVGTLVERFIGIKKYLISYFVVILSSNIVSTLTSLVLMNDTTYSISIGASGAVMGMFAILIFLFKRIQLPINQLVFIVVLNLITPFFVDGIDLYAHLFGFLMGVIISFGLGLIDRLKYSATDKLFYTVTISMVVVSIVIDIIIFVFFNDLLTYVNLF